MLRIMKEPYAMLKWLVLGLLVFTSVCHQQDGDDEAILDFCGTQSPPEEERRHLQQHYMAWKEKRIDQKERQLTIFDTNYTIPLQFIILQAEDGRGNISDSQLDTLLTTTNSYFDETPFSFQHIGTLRVSNDTFFKCDPDFEYEFKSRFRIGEKETLNIYLCNLFAQGRFGIYGVADFPAEEFVATDAVMLMNPILPKQGVTFGYMEGVMTHEIGHWLGLYHTFEGGCDPEKQSDDVEDTPAHAQQTSRSADPLFNCWQELPDGPLDTCDDDVVGIDAGIDPVDNFMNYIGKRGDGEKGQCYKDYGRFTPGQIERMVMMYETFRKPSSVETAAPVTNEPTASPTITTGTVVLPTRLATEPPLSLTVSPTAISTGAVVLPTSLTPSGTPSMRPTELGDDELSNDSIPPSSAASAERSDWPSKTPSESPTSAITEMPITLAPMQSVPTASPSKFSSFPLPPSPSTTSNSKEEKGDPLPPSGVGLSSPVLPMLLCVFLLLWHVGV